MKTKIQMLFLLLAGFLLLLQNAEAQYPTPYITTGCWNINANGHHGIGANGLCITSVVGGSIKGTVYGTDPIEGFFHATTGEITFIRSVANNNAREAQQVFVGYWFPDNRDYPYGAKRLAGSFYAAGPAAGGFPTRHTFGWTATRPY